MFDNYWRGGGDQVLSSSRFAAIVKAAKNLPGDDQNIILASGSKGKARIVNFYNSPEYALAFGRATIYYNDKGQAVGFYDYYDFDSKPWGSRSTKNKLKTRAVESAGNYHGAVPFQISYGIGKK